MIEIKLNDSQIQNLLRQVKAKLGNLEQPLDSIGQYLSESVRDRFNTQTDPDGNAWEARKQSTITQLLDQKSGSRKKDGSISKAGERYLASNSLLKRSKSLYDSIGHEVGGDGVTIKTGALPYAAAHNFGGKPYTIRPRNKKALAFGGIVRRSVRHPGQTARPFLGFSDENRSVIADILKEYLEDNP